MRAAAAEFAPQNSIVVASEDAFFAITEVRWGLIAAPILPQLGARIGLANVRRYALTAERFAAHRAREIGLVNEVCASGKLDEATRGTSSSCGRRRAGDAQRPVASYGELFDRLIHRRGGSP